MRTRIALIITICALLPLHTALAQPSRMRVDPCRAAEQRAKELESVIDNRTTGRPPQLHEWTGVGSLAPESDRGKTARFALRVSREGKPNGSTIQIYGVDDAKFMKELRNAVNRARFKPALMSGCPVEGTFEGSIAISDSGAAAFPEWTITIPALYGLKVGEQCASQRDRARGGALGGQKVGEYTPPVPTKIVLPPSPVPASVRGNVATFTVVVDSASNMLEETAKLTGIESKNYSNSLMKGMSGIVLSPASLEGCAVEGLFLLTFRL